VPFGDATSSQVFKVGSAAKQWAASSVDATSRSPRHESALESVQPPVNVQQALLISDASLTGSVADRVHAVADKAYIPDTHDDAAGIGVCGEHRAAGIGVKAVSDRGMGLAAYSTKHEAVHAETHSPVTAAIAAYHLNPHGTGAAIFAKKEGTQGHAGFFDGKVWISRELAVGGDILLANADCAEDFDVVDLSAAAPGTVMVIGDDGVLQPCYQAYDRRAVGVISGAGQYRAGLILDKQSCSANRSPVALLSKVCCWVTAEFGGIEIGDLLTTSAVTGLQ
jgi:hypothetical protein